MADTQVIELNDNNFDQEVIQATEPVLVDFYGDHCMPCKMLAPTIEQLAGEYAGRAKVAKVNVQDAMHYATQYNISAVPTIFVFKDGIPRRQFTGLKSKDDLANAINEVEAEG